ncbi:MAG: NAD(P)(+) transhydrogenase (Re/Si-specific) subunit beta [Gemmatimonadetes bacterium]|mgnify:FL=1|nr:NAD(P)(+) transhydrogenase (Re/Si-specific) subunit beta [Gemmatimonadota bacterium]|tara:strand:- start:37 stop:1419 length:1383 start_codon:yes stop_codon:yes gene_type:complete
MDTGIQLTYLLSAILFVVGLKRLQSPATARKGNSLAALAMLLAIIATVLETQILDWTWILVGVVLGGMIGGAAARSVEMTAMPELVGIFNAFGGGASALVAIAEFLATPGIGASTTGVTILLGTLIGSVTFSGSFIAFAKLKGLMTGNPITFPFQNAFNALLFLAAISLGAVTLGVFGSGDPQTLFYVFCVLALILGILLVIPIGGADMPVVISLLNSYSGLAASAAGFVIGNTVLIISGALVGASGLILTQLMCKGMNRSLANVAFGGFGGTAGVDRSEIGQRPVQSADAEGVAAELGYVNSVVVVPGYGLAVAQSQHELRKVGDLLEERGVDVKYAIHPVAGRMPGHMNVLLAEADVSYDKLYDLDEINDDFGNTDAVLVVGANDVVNPAARDPQSVITGMPILDVDRARRVIVMKRSLSPGFAGIDNDLFYMDNTLMFFGDAKESMAELVREVRELA